MSTKGLERTLDIITQKLETNSPEEVLFSEEILELIQETLENKVEEDKVTIKETIQEKIEEELPSADEEDHVDDESVVDYTDIHFELGHYELDPAAAQAFYKQTVDYDELYAGMGVGKVLTGHDVEYESGVYETEHSAQVHSQKAAKVMRKIQQSLMLKSSERIDVKDKEAFALWQEFNKVLLTLYHVTNPMRTQEVNYGTINTMDASLVF